MSITWHLITGEYPPRPGGVGDYTSLVAQGLADAGRDVHVWTRGDDAEVAVERGVHVHRNAGTFGPLGLRTLSKSLNRFPKPRRVLVQYTPFAFGWKAMNLPLAAWVWARRRLHGDDVQTMFHEVWFPWVRRPLRHNLLAAVQRVMAFLVARGSRTSYVSTTAWEPLIKSVHASANVIWLPVPANVAAEADPATVAAFRATLPAGPVIVHFGTYGQYVGDILTPTLQSIMKARPDVTLLLLGRGSDTYRTGLVASQPEWAPRIVATGSLSAEQVAVALRASDLAVQPYPDGASTRRGSLMAVLANGVPVVTTYGRLSETLWRDCGLTVVSAEDPRRIATEVLLLLNNETVRKAVGEIGRNLYQERFTLQQTLDSLYQDEGSL